MRQGQRDDRAGLARTGGTAGTVQVVLVVTGRVHVQDQVDAVDVDTAGGDVGGDQDVDVTVLEVGQRAGPRALRHAAVQRVGAHTGVAQLLGDAVGAELGADEDDGAALAGGDGGGDRRLVLRLHDQHVVGHGGDRALGRVDLVGRRVGQVALDQGADLVLHRGGEQHPLAAGRDQVEQLGDLGQEAQVGHLVGLVQDGGLDVVQRAGAAVDDVAQPAGGGDEDVDAALQRVDLVAHGRTAADDLELEAQDVAVRLQRVADLHGQLTGRGEDDAARALLRGVAAGQAAEQRQTEGEGLAGAGTAAAEDVASGQRVGDRRGLDGERGGDTVRGQLADDLLVEAEVTEGDLRGRVLGGGVGGGVDVGVGVGVGGRLGRSGHLGRRLDDGLVLRLVLLGSLLVGSGQDGLISGNRHAKCETFRSLGTGTRPNSVRLHKRPPQCGQPRQGRERATRRCIMRRANGIKRSTTILTPTPGRQMPSRTPVPHRCHLAFCRHPCTSPTPAPTRTTPAPTSPAQPPRTPLPRLVAIPRPPGSRARAAGTTG